MVDLGWVQLQKLNLGIVVVVLKEEYLQQYQ
jgi:hypothetical protein